MSRGPFSARFYTAVGLALAVAAVAVFAVALRYGRLPAEGGPAPAPRRSESVPTGGEPEAYSATVTRRFEHAGESRTLVTRVARRGDWVRTEWTEGGRRMASIVRPDLGTLLLVDLDENVYHERPLAAPPAEEAGDALGGEEVESLVAGGAGATATRERAGTESVAGYDCVVYRSRIESPLGGVAESTVWEATDLDGLAVRSELHGADGSLATTALDEIHLDPDPLLFEPPAGARRVEGPGAP